MVDRDALALALYAKWIIEADGDADPGRWNDEDWYDWQHDRPLNSVGLTKQNFLEEADWLLDLIGPHLGAVGSPLRDHFIEAAGKRPVPSVSPASGEQQRNTMGVTAGETAPHTVRTGLGTPHD